tara:strand:+ start:426 stop:1643 length:1218 start_codon:yes stop_codon:yes gene_type:complete
MSERETAKQENGSKVFFEGVIESNKSTEELLVPVFKVYPDLAKDPKLREKWITTYEKQALALKKYLRVQTGYAYSRDERTGFMEFIDKIIKNRGGVSQPNNWNPADIYMIKKREQANIQKEIERITNTDNEKGNLISLNEYMKKLITDKKMLPISLKAITKQKKEATVELANMGGKKLKSTDFKLNGPLKCFSNFGTNSTTPKEIDNGEISGQMITSTGAKINWQIRNFTLSTSMGGVQVDLTPTGAEAGAKLGKASGEAIDDFFKKNYAKLQVVRPKGPGPDPNIDKPGEFTEENKKYWVDFQKALSKLTVNGEKIDFGGMIVKINNKEVSSGDFANVLDYAIRFEKSSRYSAGRLRSKLTCLRWAYLWTLIDKKGLMGEFLKTLYYGAKKEFKEENGPFIKLF